MAEQKNYAYGFKNTNDQKTYYYRDAEAQNAIESLQGENRIIGGQQTVTSDEDGGENVFTFTKKDGTTANFVVKNGSSGTPADFPTSLPANGGNADTVGGYHFVVASEAGTAPNTIYFVV